MAEGPTVIVSRQRGAEPQHRAIEDTLLSRCTGAGYHAVTVPHLYHIAHQSPVWDEIAAIRGPVALVTWMHPRPAEWTLRSHVPGLAIVAAVDLARCEDAEAAFEAIRDAVTPSDQPGSLRELSADVTARWYPVIDRERCTSCGHCLQFCLFGVYEGVGGEVVVASPDRCKDGCPACSRICPRGAIIFPLSDDPQIAGAPGTLMQPDAAARRMYYVRTGRQCPECGRRPEAGELTGLPASALVCEECGSPLAEGEASANASPVHDEIDDLIDALDRLAAGPGSDAE